MTDQEYKQAEGLSLEMLDWLFAKKIGSVQMMIALIKTTALFIIYNKIDGVSIAQQHAAFLAAMKNELKTAAAFAEKNPMPKTRN